MLSQYAFYIRKKDGSIGERLTDVETVSILETVNDPGTWNLTSITPVKCPFEAGDGIIVIRDGSVYYTGVMTSMEETYSAFDELYTWKVSGASDLIFLTRRVAYPDPVNGSTTTVSHYTDSGTLAEVIARLIDRNLGPDAMAERKEAVVGSCTLGDTGTPVTVALRFQTLLKAVTTLLDSQGFSIRANWNSSDKKVHYQIYSGVDRSSSMLFNSSLSAILSSTYTADAPEGNYVISAGEGQEVARRFAYATDADSIAKWGRIEFYHDMRSTDDADLQTDADTTLAEASETNMGYSAEMASDAFNMVYKTDWNIGDYIAASIHGETHVQRILQVETSVSYDEETITPTLGTVKQSQFKKIFTMLKNLRSDVNQLQAVSD